MTWLLIFALVLLVGAGGKLLEVLGWLVLSLIALAVCAWLGFWFTALFVDIFNLDGPYSLVIWPVFVLVLFVLVMKTLQERTS